MHFPDLVPLSIFLLGGLLLLVLILTASISYQMMHPPRLSAGVAAARGWWIDPTDAGLEFDEWNLSLEGRGEVPVWEIDHPTDLDGPVLILTHDWGESKIVSLQRVAGLLPYVSRIVLWDMPGHGDAPNDSVCRLGHEEVHFLNELVSRSAEDRPVILYGWGMGARVSLWVAVRHALVYGTIINAPSGDYREDIRRMLLNRHIPRFPFEMLLSLMSRLFIGDLTEQNMEKSAERLGRPLMVFVGPSCRNRCKAMAQAVAERAPASEFVELNDDENVAQQLSEVRSPIEKRFRNFIQACVARSIRDRGGRSSSGSRGGFGSTASVPMITDDTEL